MEQPSFIMVQNVDALLISMPLALLAVPHVMLALINLNKIQLVA